MQKENRSHNAFHGALHCDKVRDRITPIRTQFSIIDKWCYIMEHGAHKQNSILIESVFPFCGHSLRCIHFFSNIYKTCNKEKPKRISILLFFEEYAWDIDKPC